MIKQITCILLLSVSLLAQAQNKEVKITKKSKNGYMTVIDTNTVTNNGVDSTINTNVNLSIVVDGDNITINGKPADKNDPRLKIIKGRGKMRMNPLNGEFKTLPDMNDEMQEIEIEDMMAPQAPVSNKAFLGVITEAATSTKGARINTVSEESPAQKAGLKVEDVITKVNDKSIDGPKALYEAIGTCKPEEKINITYLRAGKELKATAVLAKNKAGNINQNFSFVVPNGQMPNNFKRGFRISPDQNFNFEMPDMPALDGMIQRNNKKPKLGLSIEDTELGEGVRIKSVSSGSNAEKAGLKVNDIITQFDDEKVTDVSDLQWEYLQEGQVLKFTILRNGEKKQIEVKIPKKLKTADL
ncbi:MAG: hypothetical protein RLZ56_700 [Bacteroidota bacterium]|jgi:serine protease Do